MDKGRVFSGSTTAFRSQLDYESLPQTDISVEGTDVHTYYPLSKISDASSTIEINIPSSFTHFIDFSDSILYVRLRILKSDGQLLDSSNNISVSFNAFAALFDSIEIVMNGTVVSKSASLYPIKCHLVDLLTHSSTYKNSIMSSQLFMPDSVQDDFSASTNEGFRKRLEYTKLSSYFELSGRICEGVMNCPKYFPPDISTTIILRRSSPEFVLVGSQSQNTTPFPYKIDIEKLALHVRRYSVSSQIMAYHNKLLSSGKSFHFPMRTLHANAFSIASGTQSVLSECIFRGSLPEFIIITFLDSRAINGSLSHSPFNFQSMGIQSLSASIDGDSSLFKSIEFNEADKVILEAYNTLCLAIPDGEDHGISREDYLKGNFMVVLGISPNNSGGRFQAEKLGNVKIQLAFKKPLDKNIHCVVVGQFQSVLTIDKYRNVSMQTI
jgi:hypothetical protein